MKVYFIVSENSEGRKHVEWDWKNDQQIIRNKGDALKVLEEFLQETLSEKYTYTIREVEI